MTMMVTIPSSGLEWTSVNRACVEYRCEDNVSWLDVGVIPLLIGVSPGRKITEKLPDDELFITPASSDGDEHDSDFVSRNKGDPVIKTTIKIDYCMLKPNTGVLLCECEPLTCR